MGIRERKLFSPIHSYTFKVIHQRAQKTQANVAALQATQQREHRHREHRHRSSRPVDNAQAGANGSPIILSPAAAQVKDRDRTRRQQPSQARELAMSVQPIPPTSRQGSHLNREREREKETSNATLPAAHPYASATAAAPTSPNGGAMPGGTFPRTTSNSPLPPIPGDERERERALGMGTSNSNVALATQSAVVGAGQTYSYANGSGSGPTMSRGMSVARMDGLGYSAQGMGGVIEEEQPRHRGFFALLCCRS